MKNLDFDWLDDETCQIWLDNELIYTMEHGPHGWDGMRGIHDALYAIATQAKWAVRIFGEPGI